ncbi:hypothetical protein [Butyrivibrio sp.]|uniref:hypothetical protein n=1 Tax=Butyrivibrio sp. TaxID=28121 RepID=UPI0025BB1F62|nr:hypothetical protein [Butyrivibrio sp.]MBQ9305663.1 hypothetical protein [Butyrivibrio sp.]
MSNNRVTRLFMAVMVAGALVGCGSKEVAQETTPVVEATVEENAVDAAASTEESVVNETVVEEVEPQSETRKVLAGWVRKVNGEYTDVYSYIYDENGELIKVIFNNYTLPELVAILESEDLSAEDFMNFGEKYTYEYVEVTKSENGRMLEGQWYSADGTDLNDRVVYTYNDAGSELTKDEYVDDWETHVVYTYDENGYRTSEDVVDADGTTYGYTAESIVSEVDEDGTMTYANYNNDEAVLTYYYTTIEVPVQ